MAAPMVKTLATFAYKTNHFQHVFLRWNTTKFNETSCTCLRHQHRSLSLSYNRQKQIKKVTQKEGRRDPRENVQYPYIHGDPVQESMISNLNQPQVKKVPNQVKNTEKKVKRIKNLTNVFQTSSGLVYEKILEGDARLGRSLLQAKCSQPGTISDTILLEGVRLIKDALSMGATGQALYFTDVSLLDQLPAELLKDLKLYKILFRDLKTWSDTATPSGLLGIFQKPGQGEVVCESDDSVPITLILDTVTDPGNVGTLIRTAAAVGCQQVLAVRGNVNLWEAKVLRSAMGGHFSVALHWGLHWSDVHNLLTDQTQVLLADTRAGRTLQRAFDPNMDSGQFEKSATDTDNADDSSEEDDEDETEEDAVREWKQTPQDHNSEARAYKYHRVPLSVYEYSNAPVVTSAPLALVVGGETRGLSAQAKKFAFDRYGHYVTIPMAATVNSLNTGVAGSVLLYELRRRILELNKQS